MAAVALTNGNTLWLGLERLVIVSLAVVYIGNTIAELADTLRMITLHPRAAMPGSLLSSSVAMWIGEVVIFALLYWRLDGGGLHAGASAVRARPDWSSRNRQHPNTCRLTGTSVPRLPASGLHNCDGLQSHRCLVLESAISLLTLAVVLARAINIMPTN